MSNCTVSQALSNWFSKPLARLPRELRPIAEAYIKEWSSLSKDERQARAAEIDRQRVVKTTIKLARGRRELERVENDSLKIAESTVGWWDATMSAAFWGGQPSITPQHAALILCRFDPSRLDGSDPETDSTDETGPDDYARLLCAFNSLDCITPAHRTLADWLTYAATRTLKYHSWVDEYASAIDVIQRTQIAEVALPVDLTVKPEPSAVPACAAKQQIVGTPAAQSAEPTNEPEPPSKLDCLTREEVTNTEAVLSAELAEQSRQLVVEVCAAGEQCAGTSHPQQISKREMQVRAIEAAILLLGYNSLKIPRGGKKKIEAACKDSELSLFGHGSEPFREAWQKAVQERRVRMAEHDIFSRRY